MLFAKLHYFLLRGFWKLLYSQTQRKFLFQYEIERSVHSFGEGLKVNGPCSGFSKKVTLGSYVNFNGLRIIGNGKVRIGDYFHSGESITIITSNHNYNDPELESIPYGKRRINKNVIIEDFVWLGHGVIILPGVTIGEGAVIGAGAIVSKDVPRYAVAAGNPATVLKYRNIDQFLQLKSEGKFL
jgi:acetyltransferase-like isoleucine patch superfamily enzyme